MGKLIYPGLAASDLESSEEPAHSETRSEHAALLAPNSERSVATDTRKNQALESDSKKFKVPETNYDFIAVAKDGNGAERAKDGEYWIDETIRSEGWASKLCQPYTWLAMLCRELNGSFVFGIMVTYGVSQGMGGAIFKIAGGYYWKDVQKVQPAASQLYGGIIGLPSSVKPLWGLLSDLLPVAGYHRRPYFIISGLLGLTSILVLVFSPKLHASVAVLLLMLSSLAVAVADVTIDAVVAQRSHEKPSLAADAQALCSTSSAVGALVGFLLSGLAVDVLGSKGALGILSFSGVLFLLLGLVLHEGAHPESKRQNQVWKRFKNARRLLWTTLKCPQVWRPALYMYISWATSPAISDAKFFWYTNPKLGLGFSEEFVGFMFAVGSAGALIGTVIYQKALRRCSFRTILFWAQILVFVGGTIDLFLVLRWNLKIHISDAYFLLIDEIVIQSVSRLKWIPQLILCAKLCPAGIEGTFFALLMSIDHVGNLTAAWSGGVLVHSLGVTREDYTNLWLATLIRNLLRLLPLAVLFLVPNSDPDSALIPPELARLGCEEEGNEEADDVELVGRVSAEGAILDTQKLIAVTSLDDVFKR